MVDGSEQLLCETHRVRLLRYDNVQELSQICAGYTSKLKHIQKLAFKMK
jgi:hypothetical protein